MQIARRLDVFGDQGGVFVDRIRLASFDCSCQGGIHHPANQRYESHIACPDDGIVGAAQHPDGPQSGAVRNFVMGIVLPTVLCATVIWTRIDWKTDIHPLQIQWIVWVGSTSLSASLFEFGIRIYWWENGCRKSWSRRR